MVVQLEPGMPIASKLCIISLNSHNNPDKQIQCYYCSIVQMGFLRHREVIQGHTVGKWLGWYLESTIP